MYTDLAIMLAMCMKTAPSLKDHWSRDPLLVSPWIYEKMERDRWLAIHKALHFDILLIESPVHISTGSPHKKLSQASYPYDCPQQERPHSVL